MVCCLFFAGIKKNGVVALVTPGMASTPAPLAVTGHV